MKAKNSTSRKDPIVYLQGGPGGATLFMAYFFRDHSFRLDRDIVLMDQRGTGASAAICTNFGEEMLAIIAQDLSPAEEYNLLLEKVANCKKEVKKKQVDVSGYNSRENAADFEDLRKQLGYKQWNLFGGSYGSRLGLTLMRDFPQSIRSSILFGVFPPEIDLYRNFIGNFKASLFRTFDACANDLDCNKKYPDLKTQFAEAIEQLQNAPIHFKNNGEDFALNAQDALLVMHQLLYSKTSIAQVPSYIDAIRTKNKTTLQRILQPSLANFGLINAAMYMSVNAYEELPFNGDLAFKEDLNRTIEIPLAPAFFSSDAKTLEQWHPFRADSIENAAVVSNIPTLVANGDFDPVTPSSNAALVAQSLSHSYLVTFAWESHNLFSSCFFEICSTFLDTPDQQPDFSCVSSKPSIPWD